jgi:cell division protein FtsB
MTTAIRRWLNAVSVNSALLAEVEALRQEKTALAASINALEADNEVLIEANHDLEQQNLRLQDRLDGCLEDRKKLWEMVQETARGERTAYQMHINAAWQGRGAGVPYPDAPHLPSSPSLSAGGPMSLAHAPSQAIHRRTVQVAKDLIEKLSS